MKGKRFVKEMARKAVAITLLVALIATVLPNFNGIANATGGLTLQKPVLLVTGTETYDSSGEVLFEKSYTMADLEKIKDVNGQYYSASKSKNTRTKSYFVANGVKVTSLVGEDAQYVKFISLSGFGDDKTFNLKEPRYFYDYKKNDKYFGDQVEGEYQKESVPTIITWENAYTENEEPYIDDDGRENEADYPNALPNPGSIVNNGYLRTMCGQIGQYDANQSSFNGKEEDPLNQILVGDVINESIISINGKEYTRAQLLLMDFAEKEYTRGIKVRGVPMATLLEGVADTEIIEFESADGSDLSKNNMTVGELKQGNFILAYEVDGEPVFDVKNNKKGYLALYGDGFEAVKMINNASIAQPIADESKAEEIMDEDAKVDEPSEDVEAVADTGDESTMLPWIVVMGIAVIAGTATLFFRRKKTN